MYAWDNLNRWITATAKYPIAFTCTYVHTLYMHSRLSAFVSTTTVHTLWTVTLFRKLKFQNRSDFWMGFYHRCVRVFFLQSPSSSSPATTTSSSSASLTFKKTDMLWLCALVCVCICVCVCVRQANEWHVNNMRLVCFSLSFITICKTKRKKSSNKLHGNDDERLRWQKRDASSSNENELDRIWMCASEHQKTTKFHFNKKKSVALGFYVLICLNWCAPTEGKKWRQRERERQGEEEGESES